MSEGRKWLGTPEAEQIASFFTSRHQIDYFYNSIANDQRLGQAFFNALRPSERNRLVGSLHDPFYKNDVESVLAAIEYLTGGTHA